VSPINRVAACLSLGVQSSSVSEIDQRSAKNLLG
jgi:hypothetical protein